MYDEKNVNYGEIKEKIKTLQLTLLVHFFESVMYQAFGENWKRKVVEKARYKYLKKDHPANYSSLINAAKLDGEFNIDALDITVTVTLICYDFLDKCCDNANISEEDLLKIINKLRKDRNSFAHSSLNEDSFQNCLQTIKHLNEFVVLLEQCGWKYEANDNFINYLQLSGRQVSTEISFLKDIKRKLIDFEGELKIHEGEFFKKIVIEFIDDKQNPIDGISANIFSKDNPEILNYSLEKSNQELPLPLGKYIVTCISVPDGYDKFQPVSFVIKASDDNKIYKRIILENNGNGSNERILEGETLVDADMLFEQGCEAYKYSKKDKTAYSKAFQLFKKAADLGNVEALNNLGYMYFRGEGIPKDYKKACELYEQAAVNGSVLAANNLGSMYRDGNGVAQDYKKAFELYEQAAEQDYGWAIYNLGLMYSKGMGMRADYLKAVELYEKAADLGNVDALNNLGYMYAQGQGVAKNIQKAIELYEKAAEQGCGLAMYNLGYLYFIGEGVKTDYEKAVEFYEKAIECGLDERKTEVEKIKYKLGEMYFYGRDVNKDYNKALRWYSSMTASYKLIDIEYKLGKCYEATSKSSCFKSQRIDENLSMAAEHYRNAARKGFEPAREALYNLVSKHPKLRLVGDKFLVKETNILKRIFGWF